jgi:hypothetical protein
MVISQAPKMFTHIVQALEAETLQGQTLERVVTSAKQLLTIAGVDANQLLASMPPETQQTVRAYFWK